jgi:hypothetical protein
MTYDSGGHRTSLTTSAGTRYFHYAGNLLVAESDANGVLATYAYGPAGPPISVTVGGATYYYQTNAHSDVVSLTDSTGAVVNSLGLSVIFEGSGLSFDPSPYVLLELWLQGRLPETIYYSQASKQMQEMIHSRIAAAMRGKFAAEGYTCTTFDWGTGEAFWKTVATRLYGLGLLQFVYTFGNTPAQVGGFAGGWVRNNGNGTVTYHIENTLSLSSFLGHYLYPEDWNRPPGSGPASNVTQVFEWTEPLIPDGGGGGGFNAG